MIESCRESWAPLARLASVRRGRHYPPGAGAFAPCATIRRSGAFVSSPNGEGASSRGEAFQMPAVQPDPLFREHSVRALLASAGLSARRGAPGGLGTGG